MNAKHQIIFTSPEMCLYHPLFSKLMRSAEFMKNVCMIAIDEAHCVSQWGDGFRKAFGELGRLRSFVPTSIPVLATSATLTPLALSDIRSRLHFSAQETFLVNLGNHRANITNILVPMRTANDLGTLDFLADEALSGQPLRRTIVFFNTRDLAYKGSKHLKMLLPEARQHEIGFLHAGRNRRARRKVLIDFRKGEINILCATEAAGMVWSSYQPMRLNIMFLGHGYTRCRLCRSVYGGTFLVCFNATLWTCRTIGPASTGYPPCRTNSLSGQKEK